VRRPRSPSELARLAAPLLGLLDAGWQRMHWWVAAMAVLYAVSGVTVVKPDEVAVVLRWGRLVGETPASRQHGPGLLFAFPRPIDRVVRVQTRHVWELAVSTLASAYDSWSTRGPTLDPLVQGYALTGDQNIVHVDMVARYRVRDPAEWAFYAPKAEDVLRVDITAATVRSLGEMGVDQILAGERKRLVAVTTQRAQAALDDAHSGLELSSLELTRLAPPAALANEFDAVQSAFIGAETTKKEAEGFAQAAIPTAQADADASVQSAWAAAASDLARARGEATAFLALDQEYRANPTVVRERLYRDAMDRALAAATVDWVPPPAGARYQGLRVSITRAEAGAPAPMPQPAESQSRAGSPTTADTIRRPRADEGGADE